MGGPGAGTTSGQIFFPSAKAPLKPQTGLNGPPTYGAAGELTADDNGKTYTYNADGMITASGGATYTYDGPVAALLVDVFLPSNQLHHVQINAEESPQLPR